MFGKTLSALFVAFANLQKADSVAVLRKFAPLTILPKHSAPRSPLAVSPSPKPPPSLLHLLRSLYLTGGGRHSSRGDKPLQVFSVFCSAKTCDFGQGYFYKTAGQENGSRFFILPSFFKLPHQLPLMNEHERFFYPGLFVLWNLQAKSCPFRDCH